MGWLAKIAQTALKIVSIATGFAPMLQGAVQGTPTASTVSQITDDLTKIGGVITTVETVFAAMGNQNDAPSKIKAAVPLIAQIIHSSELMIGKKITNETQFEQACSEIAAGVSDLLNAIDTQ